MDYKIFNFNLDLGRESRNAIKPVQGESAVKLRPTLTHNSQPFNLTDCDVRCLFRKPDMTYSYIDGVIIDAAKGIVEIALTNQVLLLSGSVVGLIEVTGAIGIARTWLFTMDVQPGMPLTDVISMDEFPAVEQMLIDVADIKANFNAIVGEVILARDGKQTLNERLNQDKAGILAQLGEIETLTKQGASFVDKMLSYINTKGIYITKHTVDLGGVNIGINLQDSLNTVIEYQFRNNGDNLLLLRGVKTGTTVTPPLPTVTLNGTFEQASAPLTYTTTIGDSFTFTFNGSGFIFKRRTESRGGLWEFHLSDGQSKKVSCYSPTTVEGVEGVVFDNLPKKTYQVRAIFIGDDKVNPPSTAPSRGYINYIASNPASFPIKTIDNCALIDDNDSRYLVSPISIPDFAVAARPVNATYDLLWVPVHSAKDVSVNVKIKLIINGRDRITVAGGAMSESFYDVENIEIIQSFDAVNPNGNDGVMWTHNIRHSISSDKPFVEISNRMEIMQDIRIDSAYLTMLPADSSNVSRLSLNNGAEYNTIPKDGTDIQLGKDISSAMFTGMYQDGRTHATAIDVLSYTESIGKRNREDINTPTRLTFRTDGVAKFYINAFSGIANTGDIFQNTQRIACISGVKFPNNLLKTI